MGKKAEAAHARYIRKYHCFVGLSTFHGGEGKGIWISDMKLFNSFSNEKNPPNLPNGYRHPLYCRRPYLKIFYRIPGQQAPPFRRPLQSRRSHLHRGICKFVFYTPFKPRLRSRIACFYARAARALTETQKYIVIYDIFTSKTEMIITIKKSNSLIDRCLVEICYLFVIVIYDIYDNTLKSVTF